MKREEEVIRAIYHKDVVGFFKSIRLLDKLERGEIVCSICGDKITIENFKTVARKSNELLFCCDKEPCIQKFIIYLRGGKK